MTLCEPIRGSETCGQIDWACERCGFRDTVREWPPLRSCSRINLDAIEVDAPRGLGDTIHGLLYRFGIRRQGCGPCDWRQEWLNRWWPYRPAPPLRVPNPDVLFVFRHGLGDAVQFTIVLEHLRRAKPDWSIDVLTQPGVHSLFRGLCRESFGGEAPKRHYDLVREVEWWEPGEVWADSPSTKAEKSLRQIFGIKPDPDLCRYRIMPSEDDYDLARERLQALTSGRVVGIHYQGTSTAVNKNMDEQAVRSVIKVVKRAGYCPMLFDWDQRSTIRNLDLPVWREHSDCSAIAAAIDQCALFVGIDSGPGHIAGATRTQSLIVWRWHHPLHYYGLSSNVLHVLRSDHPSLIRGDATTGLRYFQEHYRHHVCRRNFRLELPELVERQLMAVSA